LLLPLIGTALPGLAGAHGFLHERIGEMDRLIAANPGWAEPYLRRAELCREHGDFEAAFADIARARELQPGLARTDLHLAGVYLDQGRLDAAADSAERFISGAREDAGARHHIPRAHALLAKIALQRHDGLTAAYHLGEAISLSERPAPELFLARAEAFERAGPDHSVEAIETLEEGIRRLGPVPSLQVRALELETARRDYAAALRRVESMISRSPADPALVIRKGRILELGGEPASALDAYRLAKRLLDTGPAAKRQSSAYRSLRAKVEQAISRLSSPPPSQSGAGN
jgi:tetratricopeptide (TPR) repeat protein